METAKKIALYVAFVMAIALPTVAFAYGPGNPAPNPAPPRGAPGPIAGAGLPVLAVGYGVYWLNRRRKST